jgi:trk system potassium uptake protein TrkA
VTLYSKQRETISNFEEANTHDFPIIEVTEFSIAALEAKQAFETDNIVLATSDDDTNIQLATHAKELGIDHVVASVDDPLLQETAKDKEIAVFSTLHSTRILLKALIHNPSLVYLISNSEETIQEVQLRNSAYNGLELRKLPFLGDLLIIQIYRYKRSIIPHGDTRLQQGDILLVTGSKEHIHTLKTLIN